MQKHILKIINTIASICLQKYTGIFVLGYLFLEAHSFLRAKLEENCELLGTDNTRGQISVHIFAPNAGYCLFIPLSYTCVSRRALSKLLQEIIIKVKKRGRLNKENAFWQVG